MTADNPVTCKSVGGHRPPLQCFSPARCDKSSLITMSRNQYYALTLGRNTGLYTIRFLKCGVQNAKSNRDLILRFSVSVRCARGLRTKVEPGVGQGTGAGGSGS